MSSILTSLKIFFTRSKASKRSDQVESTDESKLDTNTKEFYEASEAIRVKFINTPPPNYKVIQTFGDVRLAPPKAAKLLGTLELPERAIKDRMEAAKMSEIIQLQQKEQMKKMQREAMRMVRMKSRELDELLKVAHGPSQQQKEVPAPLKGAYIPQKALKVFGDDYLNQASTKVVTDKMRKNVKAKTLSFFGDADLLTPKQRQLLGNTLGRKTVSRDHERFGLDSRFECMPAPVRLVRGY